MKQFLILAFSLLTMEYAFASYSPNTVVAPGNSKPKICTLFFGGGSSTLAAPTECGGSPCVEIYDSCGISSTQTRSATGTYAVVFSNGSWANSSALDCSCSSTKSTSNGTQCNTYNNSNIELAANASGGGTLNLAVYLANGTATDATVRVRCMGVRP